MLKFEIVPVTAFEQNCCLLWCSDSLEAICTDPGGDIERIRAVIQKHKLSLTRIVLTHGHLDHVGAAFELASSAAVPIYGPHPADRFWLDALSQQAAMFQFPAIQSFSPDHWLEEGMSINVGQYVFEVRHCPGHTPGHIVLVNTEQQLAIVGDVLFNGGIGRVDFPKGDHKCLMDSIQSKLMTLDNEIRIIPGHGPMTTIGHERATNPYIRHLV